MVSEFALPLAGITLIAAIVNGALGYGFSSITVPLALLRLTSRVLNPALVLVEVVLNAYVLWVNRAALPEIRWRVAPVLVGLVPGVITGTMILTYVRPDVLKLWTFLVLLPLILLQAAGLRRPIQSERTAGFALGGGVGLLYSLTTISGPPLALMLNNQGLAKTQFRAALGAIRLAESLMTAVAYTYVGLMTAESIALIPAIVPSLLVGVPVGAWLIRRVDAETFRRVCMSFDSWVVGFGISTLLQRLRIIESGSAYLVLAGVVLVDGILLYRFFTGGRNLAAAAITRATASEGQAR